MPLKIRFLERIETSPDWLVVVADPSAAIRFLQPVIPNPRRCANKKKPNGYPTRAARERFNQLI
jgi:hypothetical protein